MRNISKRGRKSLLGAAASTAALSVLLVLFGFWMFLDNRGWPPEIGLLWLILCLFGVRELICGLLQRWKEIKELEDAKRY